MKAIRRRSRSRLMWGAVLVALTTALAGDRSVRSAVPVGGWGIDPLSVLDAHVTPNLMILLDTSASMHAATSVPGFRRTTVGGDNPLSRMAQAKVALQAAVEANAGKANIGMLSFNVDNTQKPLNRNGSFIGATHTTGAKRNDGPLIYVTNDPRAAVFYRDANLDGDYGGMTDYNAGGDLFSCPDPGDGNTGPFAGFFCDIRDDVADYDTNKDIPGDPAPMRRAIFKSFGNRGVFSLPYPATGVWDTTVNIQIPGAADATCPEGMTDPDPANPNPACTFHPPICDRAAGECRYFMQSRGYRDSMLYTWDLTQGTLAQRLVQQGAFACPAPPAGLLSPSEAPGVADALTTTPPCFAFRLAGDAPKVPPMVFWYTSAVFQTYDGSTGEVDTCTGTETIAGVPACTDPVSTTVTEALRREIPLVQPNPASSRVLIPGLAPNGSPLPDLMDGSYNPGLAEAPGLRAAGKQPLQQSLGALLTTSPFPVPPSGASPPKNYLLLVIDANDLDDIASSGVEPPDEDCGDSNTALAAKYAHDIYYDVTSPAEVVVVAFASSREAAERAHRIARAGSGGQSLDFGPGAVTCPPDVPCRGAYIASGQAAFDAAVNEAFNTMVGGGRVAPTPSSNDVILEYVQAADAGASPLDPETRYSSGFVVAFRASFDVEGFKGHFEAFDDGGYILWDAAEVLLDRVDPTLLESDAAHAPQTFVALVAASNAQVAGQGIPRRIFTTGQNGVSLTSLMLWPPDPTVAPAAAKGKGADPVGVLDSFLFQHDDGTAMTIADLTGAPWFACQGTNLPARCTSIDPLLRDATIRREAREMILAHNAGAETVRVLDAGGRLVPDRINGDLMFRVRSWILAPSTAGQPAVVTVPSNIPPSVYATEYTAYLDGERQPDGSNTATTITSGFGLRNPDDDGRTNPEAALDLKPVMSVVYLPADDGLHAFRAGPNHPDGTVRTEWGGEELWTYVPFDQLPKLQQRMKIQDRATYVYMMGGSVRFGEVFDPVRGQWRRRLYVGRGPGGRYYTGLDITVPGPFTAEALTTALPEILWNRGNGDGTSADFSGMGQTWSTPALGRVATPSDYGGEEWVLFVGSGYPESATPGEGSTFYVLSSATGEPIMTHNVDDAVDPAGHFENALVADAIVLAPNVVSITMQSTPVHPAGESIETVYLGDIHGRMWRYNVATFATTLFHDGGLEQPIGVAAAVIRHEGFNHVFFGSGADDRVPEPSGGFGVWGYVDNAGAAEIITAVDPDGKTGGFPFLFDTAPLSYPGFRVTVPPLTLFAKSGTATVAGVFFVATRFNDNISATCEATFDSLFLGIFGADWTSPVDAVVDGVKGVGLPRVSAEGPEVDSATSATGGNPPPPPAPESAGALVNLSGGSVRTKELKPNTPVCVN